MTARKTLICEKKILQERSLFSLTENWRHSFLKFSVLKQYTPGEYKVTYFSISWRPPDKKTVYSQIMHARGKRIFNTDYRILKRTNISIWSVKRKQPLTPFWAILRMYKFQFGEPTDSQQSNTVSLSASWPIFKCNSTALKVLGVVSIGTAIHLVNFKFVFLFPVRSELREKV